MAEITAQVVNEFRKKTGLGLMECKKLLTEANGDLAKAETLAKERGLKQAELRAGRAASAGRVEVYIHHDAKSGVLVELNCETDFVARTEDFQALAREISMHVAAASPQYVRREDVPGDVLERERAIYSDQVKDKPPQVVDKIVEGKLNSYYEQVCLLDQPFRDEERTVRELITNAIATIGENIVVRRFTRYALGEDA